MGEDETNHLRPLLLWLIHHSTKPVPVADVSLPHLTLLTKYALTHIKPVEADCNGFGE